jgi:hypothetical protein
MHCSVSVAYRLVENWDIPAISKHEKWVVQYSIEHNLASVASYLCGHDNNLCGWERIVKLQYATITTTAIFRGGVLVRDALWTCRWVPSFRRNILLHLHGWQHVPERWYSPASSHGVTTQKIVFLWSRGPILPTDSNSGFSQGLTANVKDELREVINYMSF